MIKILCDWCGEETEKYQSNITENNFCSRSCYNSWNAEEKSGSGNPMWEDAKSTIECDECGSEFEKLEERMTDNNFCSNSCRLDWWSEVTDTPDPMYGEDNPQWKGGYSDDYGENWTEQRRIALDDAGYECEICAMSRDEHHDEYGFDLEVHHRVPIRSFDEPENANFQSNLVVCCRNCHHSVLESNPVPHNDIRAPAH